MKIFSRYDLPAHDGERFKMPTMTQQHFKDECDINRIIEKYASGLSNITPETVRQIINQTTPPERLMSSRSPVFGDFSDVKDFQSAQNAVIEAENAFMSIPARVREKFGNDPGRFIAWLQDPSNVEEAEELGFLRVIKDETVQTPGAPVEPVSAKKETADGAAQ